MRENGHHALLVQRALGKGSMYPQAAPGNLSQLPPGHRGGQHMTVIRLRGERYVLQSPRHDEDRRKLRWIAEHYPIEAIRKEAELLLASVRCTAKPTGKACQASARRRCYLCERAICGRHSVKVHSD